MKKILRRLGCSRVLANYILTNGNLTLLTMLRRRVADSLVYILIAILSQFSFFSTSKAINKSTGPPPKKKGNQ